MDQDQEQLRLLSIFHYIVGGVTAFFSCFPLIHLFLGIAVVSGLIPEGPNQRGFPVAMGWFFIVGAAIFILMGWTLAGLMLATGRMLARRKGYTFCIVIAAIECLMMPFGTLLGVFTLIVLMRPSVKMLFETEGLSP